MRKAFVLAALVAGLGILPAGAAETVEPAASSPPASTVEPPPPVPKLPADASAPKPVPVRPPSVIARINLTTQQLDVSVDGAHRHTWAISSGRAGYATPRGTFRPQWTARMWYSKKYDNAPMPHAVFFNGGVAVHATNATGLLGRPASHGCVRLAPAHAAQFYALVQRHGLTATQIQVFGTPPQPQARIAEARDRSEPRRINRGVDRVPGRAVLVNAGARDPRMVRLPPGSPYAGMDTFEHNGVRYVRIR